MNTSNHVLNELEKLDEIVIDDNGINHFIYNQLFPDVHKQFIRCEYCLKYYLCESNIVIKDKDNYSTCMHCLYFINYDKDLRTSVDGKYGLTIADYILKYKSIHNKYNCNTSCFICDHLHGKYIEGIKYGHKVNIKRRISVPYSKMKLKIIL